MFVFKKVVAPLLNPVPLCLELLAIGLIFLWFTRKQFVGKVLVTMAGILLTLLGTPGISGRLLHTLEAPYPPLEVDALERKPIQINEPPARWIVVLAGGIAGDSSLPLALQISHHSRVRLVEGVRLYHHFPGSKLVLSGGNWFSIYARSDGVEPSGPIHGSPEDRHCVRSPIARYQGSSIACRFNCERRSFYPRHFRVSYATSASTVCQTRVEPHSRPLWSLEAQS